MQCPLGTEEAKGHSPTGPRARAPLRVPREPVLHSHRWPALKDRTGPGPPPTVAATQGSDTRREPSRPSQPEPPVLPCPLGARPGTAHVCSPTPALPPGHGFTDDAGVHGVPEPTVQCRGRATPGDAWNTRPDGGSERRAQGAAERGDGLGDVWAGPRHLAQGQRARPRPPAPQQRQN